jgi:hypothetical protein
VAQRAFTLLREGLLTGQVRGFALTCLRNQIGVMSPPLLSFGRCGSDGRFVPGYRKLGKRTSNL